MNIRLVKELRSEETVAAIARGTTIEELYKQYAKQLPYTVLAAKVDNKIEGLDHRLSRECRVEFLDMRTQAANLIYQNSLIQIYLKAIEDILGKADVDIENALNKGLYTEIKAAEPVTAKQVKEIEQRMHHIVE